jgi:hypothetical protein
MCLFLFLRRWKLDTLIYVTITLLVAVSGHCLLPAHKASQMPELHIKTRILHHTLGTQALQECMCIHMTTSERLAVGIKPHVGFPTKSSS